MSEPFKIQGSIWEDGSATILARLVGRGASGVAVVGEGNALQKADVSAIVGKVYFLDSPTPETPLSPSLTVTVAGNCFDTLQTDASWTVDVTGYNLAHDLAATYFTPPGLYRVQYLVTCLGGRVFAIVAELSVAHLRGA